MVSAGAASSPPRLLHVGCGDNPLPEWLSQYAETRLDIDPGCKPDVVASMTDLGEIGGFDMLLCRHALEHLYPHDVEIALREFVRVLKPGGAAVVCVPDLQDVRPTEDVLFFASGGPITGVDMFFGFRPLLKERPHMAHHTGFVRETLEAAMRKAGFDRLVVERVNDCYELLGVGIK
jgi:SAM-dependent methyltransferase